MSDLQIGLIIAGAVLIIGIYCLTKIQERKIQKKEEDLYRMNQQDALMDTPAAMIFDDKIMDNDLLDNDDLPDPLLALQRQEKTKISFSDINRSIMTEPRIEQSDDSGFAMPDNLNPKFDYICGIVAEVPIAGQDILDSIAELNAAKPVQWVGVESGAIDWQVISKNKRYQYLCIGLQLADRKGAITEPELDQFLTFITEFSEQSDAELDIPDTDHVIERAQTVDDFCADVDIQIAIHIVANTAQAFTGTKIRALAEASGCVLNDDAKFYRVDMATANKLFVLYNLGDEPFAAANMKNFQTHGLRLMMDLPLVADGVLVFNQMLLFARQLAQTLDGRLVDVNEQPLTDAMIDKIRRQIVVYQGKMREYGVSPGSHLAARLFSE